MTDLLTRLQDASEGSRELDRAIADHVHGKPKPPYVRGYVCNYTTSIDAALTLVPEGLLTEIIETPHRKGWRVSLWPVVGTGHSAADAPTPAIALCIAALKTDARP